MSLTRAPAVMLPRHRVSMRAALGDDDLLGRALPGPSWASWRVLLIAIMGEALLDGERPIFAELTGGREREPCELVEEFHAVVGRRSGKTRAAATLATYLAALVDHSDRLAPGERAFNGGRNVIRRADLVRILRLHPSNALFGSAARLAFRDRVPGASAPTLRGGAEGAPCFFGWFEAAT
jgi:hypothetical protein